MLTGTADAQDWQVPAPEGCAANPGTTPVAPLVRNAVIIGDACSVQPCHCAADTMSFLTYAFKTDQGRVRELNQDSLAALAPDQFGGRVDGLFVVADGIGGGNGGEVASRIAIDVVPDTVRAQAALVTNVTGEVLAEAARCALHAANAAVWKRARETSGLHGMGTTCVLALLKANQLIVGNVGDSRCYLYRAFHLLQLTHDHAFLHASRGSRSRENGGAMQFRQVMTRAIGFAGMVEPEVESFALQAGDVLLLCSDGLSNLLEDAEIAEILTAGDAPQKTCDRLVSRANANGGDDNITVIVIRYGASDDVSKTSPPSADTAPNKDRFSPLETASPCPSSPASSAAPPAISTTDAPAPAAPAGDAPPPWWKRLARLRGR